MATYIDRTQSAGNRKTFTISAWVKRVNRMGTYTHLFTAGPNPGAWDTFRFDNDDQLAFRINNDSNVIKLNRKFRDTNAWYHLVLSVDTTQATSSDRVKIYVNGVLQTSLASSGYPSQNQDLSFNNNGLTLRIGDATWSPGNQYLDGIMSHVHFTDGTAYPASTFGSTDSTTGEWKINTSPSLTMGTNGFTILKDGNTITDQSSNSNNFSLTAGVITKTEDNPSNVFATWNPLNPVDSITYSYGNCVITGSNSSNYTKSAITTLGASKGKYYWEMKHTTANANTNTCIGVANMDNYEFNQNITSGTTGYVTLRFDGERQINGATTAGYFTTPNAGDILMCAMDMDNGKVFFGNNGTWFGSGNPVTGANPTADILTSGTWGGTIRYLAAKFECNFGNGYIADNTVSSAGANASNIGIFEYDVPAGYTALCTKGLNSF
tara:strand:+ start:1170 stop:2477 length:1308 start_codon:yes stop_codon:yes gene_type:complete